MTSSDHPRTNAGRLPAPAIAPEVETEIRELVLIAGFSPQLADHYLAMRIAPEEVRRLLLATVMRIQ